MAEAAQTTCWTVIRGAAEGRSDDRAAFAARYLPVIRGYLAARWHGSPMLSELDDAVQEVFVECYKETGVLEAASPERPGGFRAYLYGVVRNVGRRIEERRVKNRTADEAAWGRMAADDDRLSCVFDRAWARSIMRQAAERQADEARRMGPDAVRRVELLRLRFHDGLPIRQIAERWGVEAAGVHTDYARARQEFRDALMAVLAFHHPGGPAELDVECRQMLALLE